MKAFFTYITRLRRQLFLKYAKKFSRNYCHVSLDTLPIFNWWRFHDTKDLTYLLLKKKRRAGWLQRKALEYLWGEIFDEYVSRFGFGDAYQEILEIQKRIIELRVELICEEDNSRLTFIDIEELKLAELQSSLDSEQNYFDLKTQMEIVLGWPIDIHVCSVVQYNAYIKRVEEKITRSVA